MPPPAPPPKPKPVAAKKPEPKQADPAKIARGNAMVLTVAVLLFLGFGEGTTNNLLTTFMLAGCAGYQAVWGVAHALHTPLMSVTNAISGMTAVGGLILLENSASNGLFNSGANTFQIITQVLAMLAILISAVNIIGGFVVSQRMLNLFRKKGESDHTWSLVFGPGFLMMVISIGTAVMFDPDKFDHRDLVETIGTISAILCVTAIGGLASMNTADMGCKFGMIGVMNCVCTTVVFMVTGGTVSGRVATTVSMEVVGVGLGCLAVGGCLGMLVGGKVNPMKLPQTVAAFHSLVGAAATLTSIGSFTNEATASIGTNETAFHEVNMENIAAILGNIIGAITLTGSLVAFGKLNGNLKSKEMNLPGKNYINISMLVACIILSVLFFQSSDPMICLVYFLALALVSMFLGIHLVASVGGGDMPVCVTVLNSYSGWALVAEGFLLKSSMLTVTGSLIGCSGAILTKIMCDAMNRDIFNVIFGGMNVAAPAKKGDEGPKVHVETTVAAVVEYMVAAKEILIVPGYGMAVARAQGPVGEVATACREAGISVRFGIHPVAGRMPGQMNVLLAEAGVPHEWVNEMTEVNPDMEKFDVVLVMGANDVVNSAAQEVEGCSIWGMPVMEVWKSKKVIFCKRSMGGGYADLENPVFFKENTEMLLGDAKKTADAMSSKLKERFASAA